MSSLKQKVVQPRKRVEISDSEGHWLEQSLPSTYRCEILATLQKLLDLRLIGIDM